MEVNEARERLRQMGTSWREAEEEVKAFCEANPTQEELNQILSKQQNADAKAAQEKAKQKFFGLHDEVLSLLTQVQNKSAEMHQALNDALPNTFREPIIANELCQPLNLWSQLKAGEGARIAEMRRLRYRL